MLHLASQGGLLLAQDSTSDPGGSLLGFLLPLVILGGLFYFVLVVPQRRRMRQMQTLRESIGIGDEVRTVGGIYGTVKSMDDDTMMIEVAAGTVLRVAKRAVADRLTGSEEG